MAILLVGSGQAHTTIASAWAASSSGDTIRLTSNITEPGYVSPNALADRNDMIIDGQGFTATVSGNGQGLLFYNCKYLQVLNIKCVRVAQTADYGIAISRNSAYVLIQNCEVDGWGAGIAGIPGRYGSNPIPSSSYEYLWVDRCRVFNINLSATFTTGPSGISSYQPGVVPGISRPAFWDVLLTEHGYPNDSNLTMAFTRNVVENVDDPPSVQDTDGNGLIIDDWEWAQDFSMPSYSNGARWSLIENNSAENCRGAGARIFNSRGPHVMRHNTAVNCGQRLISGGYPDWAGSGFSITTQGNTGDFHGAQVYGNAMRDCGSGINDDFNFSVVETGSTYRNNAGFGFVNPGVAGLGLTVTTDPQLKSTTDPAQFFPLPGSPLLTAQPTSPPAKDNVGTARSTPAAIGAFELEQVSQPPVANFSHSANGLVVDFIDLSTNMTAAFDPRTWSWNFGDTNTSTQQNPQHTYATDGVYTVTLTVTNVDGSDNTSQQVNVFVPPSGAVEVVSVTDVWIAAANPWQITVPTVQDGDVLYVIGTTVPANISSQMVRGDVTTIGFTLHYESRVPATWITEAFGMYKSMVAADSGTTFTIPRNGSHELAAQLYVLRNVASIAPTVGIGTGYDNTGSITTPSSPEAMQEAGVSIWAWHLAHRDNVLISATLGTLEVHNTVFWNLSHSAHAPNPGTGDPPPNTLSYTNATVAGGPGGTHYVATAFTVLGTSTEPPTPSEPVPTGSALVLI